jgi:hypothetical protein
VSALGELVEAASDGEGATPGVQSEVDGAPTDMGRNKSRICGDGNESSGGCRLAVVVNQSGLKGHRAPGVQNRQAQRGRKVLLRLKEASSGAFSKKWGIVTLDSIRSVVGGEYRKRFAEIDEGFR